MSRELLRNVAGRFLPPVVYRALTYYHPGAVAFYATHRQALKANRSYKNIHSGQRCFILCTGPSVLQQDIRPLHKEFVISVSNGYRHPDYGLVAPRYHCLPQLTYGKLTTATAIQWFREMDKGLGEADLFLSHQEWGLVHGNDLFRGRKVSYLCMGKNYFPGRNLSIPDMAGIVPRVQTVPILAITLALYMGFRQIYLLGTDHDWFVKKEYKYFFEPTVLKGLDQGVRADGALETSLWDELPAISRVWAEYRALKRIARAHGTTIINATHGGMLDEFERVRLDELLGR